MESNVRSRFWFESVLALLCGVLAVVTLVWRDWVEALTGVDPDRHSGALEWAIVASMFMLMVVILCAAGIEWRRARAGVIPSR
jgi:hypothetical protein